MKRTHATWSRVMMVLLAGAGGVAATSSGAIITSSSRLVVAVWVDNDPDHPFSSGGSMSNNDATGPWNAAMRASDGYGGSGAWASMGSFIDESFVYFGMSAGAGGGPFAYGIAYCELTTNFVLTQSILTNLQFQGDGGYNLTRTSPTSVRWDVDAGHVFPEVRLDPGSYTLHALSPGSGGGTVFIPAPGVAGILAFATGLAAMRRRRG